MPDTSNAILVLNSGSSSLKFGLFTPGQTPARRIQTSNSSSKAAPTTSAATPASSASATPQATIFSAAITSSSHNPKHSPPFFDALRDLAHTTPIAVGHRVVHGGPHLREHQRITPAVLSTLEAAVHFAPLHIPQSLALIRQTQQALPNTPNFACFDTAFHRTLPEVAVTPPHPHAPSRRRRHPLRLPRPLLRVRRRSPQRPSRRASSSRTSATAPASPPSSTANPSTPPWASPPPAASPWAPAAATSTPASSSTSSATNTSPLTHSNNSSTTSAASSPSPTANPTCRPSSRAKPPTTPPPPSPSTPSRTAIRKFIGAYAALLGGLDLLVFTGGIGQHSARHPFPHLRKPRLPRPQPRIHFPRKPKQSPRLTLPGGAPDRPPHPCTPSLLKTVCIRQNAVPHRNIPLVPWFISLARGLPPQPRQGAV